MDTRQPQPDTTDPALDALLDEALSHRATPADPALADRIIRETLPMLGRPPVLARIGPTLLRIAAAVLIVVGAGIAATMLTRDQAVTTPIDPGALAQIDSTVQAIAQADEPGRTWIDEQLDILAMRVDYASTDSVWSPAGQDINDQLEEAVARFEFDRFTDDAVFLSTNGSVLF